MLTVTSVTKLFGDFAACKSIDFDIKPGEIHALLGENGAGKSTLVKMLYGSLQPSSGQILWKGNPVTVRSPAQARSMGIGMVFQHFSLFEALSVSENIALSMPKEVAVSQVRAQAIEFSRKYRLPLNPDAVVGDLSVGERQRVEIVRCLLQEPELLILDEPTSVLTPQEAENLFDTVNLLKQEGRSVLFISHRLEEVRAHCDRATILRFGEVIAHCDPRQETAASLARMMVGADVANLDRKPGKVRGEIVLSVSALSMQSATPFSVSLQDINLNVHAGEIVGIAGIAGNGQSELFEALSGERPAVENGSITIRNIALGRTGINERRKAGGAFVPEERNGHGAVSGFRLSNNMLLARHAPDEEAFQKWGLMHWLRMDQVATATKRVCEANDVRKSGDDPFAASLSGGNLQKFVMG
ncbi:MAG: ABC transporter ATP-binding protein, partial [Pseudomonadota bacterium]